MYMKKSLLLVLTLACLLLFGCNTDKTNKKAEKDPTIQTDSEISSQIEVPLQINFTKETYPKVDGSTATIPLSETMASKLLQLSKEEVKKIVKHNTTHEAYVNLINGTADIILVTEPSKEELSLAKEANVELEIYPVVKEGFVFLVNKNNPINSLTSSQVKDIYQGKIKNWKELGGEDKEILAYQRDPNSGSQTLMEQLVMKGLPMTKYPSTLVYSMDGLIEKIASYDNSEKALGYSVFYYARSMYNKETVKLLSIDGIAPDNKNISSGKYPFTTAYYAVLKKNTPKDASSRKLLGWMLGKEGQKLTEEAGYVALEAEAAQAQNIKLVEKAYKTKYLLSNGIQIKYTSMPIKIDNRDSGIMLPQIDGLIDKSVEEKINSAIKSDLETEIKLYASELTEEFLGFESRVTLNANNLLCVSLHGFYTPPMQGFLYRLTDGKRLNIKDIFTEGTDYVPLLNKNVTEGILAGDALDENLLREPFKSITPNQSFSLSPSTLHVIFLKGEGGFNKRSSIAVPLKNIDNYVDVMDRYSGTERKTQLHADMFVRSNNIFTTNKGEVYKRENGNLWLYYPEISGLRNPTLERTINSAIKNGIDELKDSPMFNNLPTGDAYGKESIAVIEFTTTFNYYGILSIERNVYSFSAEKHFDNLHKVYCFDLKNGRDLDWKDLLTAYFSKNKVSQLTFVDGVKESLKQQCFSNKLELKGVSNYNIDYSYILKNSSIYFTKQYTDDFIYVYASFILNSADGNTFRVDCVVPLKDIYQGVPEDFFGW
jgi:phosphate transport system substrate-binding protein